MDFRNSENFKLFEKSVAGTGNTYAFNMETSVECVHYLFKVIMDMGLDPMKTADFRQGLTDLFNLEFINMPDFSNNRYILAPNHVSDFDAIFLGLIHPNIRIVAKNDWTNNEKLQTFLQAHYDLYGFDRNSLTSIRGLLHNAIDYFNESDENRHYLVFSQGTISDFNNNSLERISAVAQKISAKTGVPILNMFIEQVSIHEKTRVVFDKPMELSPKDDFRRVWIDREIALQNSLNPVGRRPNLSHKHRNNNKAGDEFF